MIYTCGAGTVCVTHIPPGSPIFLMIAWLGTEFSGMVSLKFNLPGKGLLLSLVLRAWGPFLYAS